MEKTQKINPVRSQHLIMTSNGVKSIISFVFAAIVFAALPAVASAATLYFSPSSGEYAVGKTLSVSVYVSSADQAMNAVSGTISFPVDKLSATAISKTGSIVSLWVQEPSFSNGNGTVNFEGIVLNPGFIGAKGKVIAVSFKVVGGGSATVNFSTGSILANDGKGTNILTGFGGAQFALEIPSTGPAAPQATTPTVLPGVPAAPQISSETHPDPNQWYAKKDAVLSWVLPAGTLSTRLSLSHIPQANPLVVYTPAVNSKEFKDLDDGIWYLHVQLRNNSGWGSVTHFQLQIDTAPPEPFSIKFSEGKETDNPRLSAYFDTTDSLSGIDYYKIKIGEGDFFTVQEIVKSNPFILPLQAPGKRTLLVQAYDKAGNYATAMEEFIINPIKAPVFTKFPEQLYSDETFEAEGASFPNSQITVWLQREDDNAFSQEIKSDNSGNFHFIAKQRLKDGIYKMWAEAIDGRGAKSGPSEEKIISVTLPLQFKIGKIFIDYITIINALLVMVLGLGLLTAFAWYKVSFWRKRVGKETRDAEQKTRQAFAGLISEVRKIVSELDGAAGLSEREKTLYEKLKKSLAASEKIIEKEIEDIRREIKG